MRRSATVEGEEEEDVEEVEEEEDMMDVEVEEEEEEKSTTPAPCVVAIQVYLASGLRWTPPDCVPCAGHPPQDCSFHFL